MMKRFAALAFLLAAPSLAHATQLSVLGGFDETLSDGGSLGYVAGAAVNFPVAMLHFEIDGLWLDRGFGDGGHVACFEIPAFLRFHINPDVSLGVGGFDDLPLTTSGSNDAGIIGSLRVHLPATLYVDGRFGVVLNQGASRNDVQLMLGVRI
jgi:hypothetical protein